MNDKIKKMDDTEAGEYWKEQYREEITEIYFHPDFKNEKQYREDTFSFSIPAVLFGPVDKDEDVYSRLAFLFSCLNILAYKYSGLTDTIISMPPLKQSEPKNGFIPFRYCIQPGMSFEDIHHEVYQVIIECYSASGICIKDFLPEHTSLCTMVFGSDTFHDKDVFTQLVKDELPGIALWETSERDEENFRCYYNASFFKKSSAEKIISSFINILQQVTSDKNILVQDIEVISPKEKRKILSNFNNTSSPVEIKTVQEILEDVVKANPDNAALVDDRKSLSYREFNGKANLLAQRLREKGVTPNTIVSIVLDRTIEMVLAMFGVLKAGGAYLPIESTFPKDRINFMIENSKSLLVITRKKLYEKINPDTEILDIDTEIMDNEDYLPNLENVNTPKDSAYVIYTSGSTGKPKGVRIIHEGVCNLDHIFKKIMRIQPEDNMTEFASVSFDTSVWEIIMCILAGATLHVLPPYVKNNYSKFEEYVNNHRITAGTFPPPYLSYINPDNVKTIRKMIVAGSVCPKNLLRNWNDKADFINAYGPTEATVCIAVFQAPKGDIPYETVPVGKPLPNKKIYILDKDLKLQPAGFPGELCVSGIGTSPEYIGRPELTREKFIANPFFHDIDKDERVMFHDRIYRTGDYARWLPDGNIEFIGRIDNQVKIRGYRIELNEIENIILKHDKIRQAAAVIRKDGEGDNILLAYFAGDSDFSEEDLRSYLSRIVPDYMVPSFIYKLDSLPLTNSDKVDRKALQAMDMKSTGPVHPVSPVENDDPLVNKIKEIIIANGKIKKTPGELHKDIPFNSLGINSLNFVKITVEIEKELNIMFDNEFLVSGRNIALGEMFEYIKALVKK